MADYRNIAPATASSGPGVFGKRQSLWLADDHLLAVTHTFATEQYRRLYFRDIQALTLRETGAARRAALLLLLVAAAAAALGAAALRLHTLPAAAGCAIVGGAALIALLVNARRGPGCVLEVTTAVQTTRLHAFNRVRTAQPMLTLLRQRSEAVQGALTPEAAAAGCQQAQGAAAQPTPEPAVLTAEPLPPPQIETFALPHPPVLPYRGRRHDLVVLLLYLTAGHTLLALFISPYTLDMLMSAVTWHLAGLALHSMLALTVVLAIAAQHETNLTGDAKRFAWWTAGFCGLHFLARSTYALVLMVRMPDARRSYLAYANTVALNPVWTERYVLTGLLVATAAAALLLALAGRRALLRFRAQAQRATLNVQPSTLNVPETPAATPEPVAVPEPAPEPAPETAPPAPGNP